MSRKHGWLDLVDLFYQPGTGSSRNEPHSFAFVVLFILILVFGLFAVFNYDGGPNEHQQKAPTTTSQSTPDQRRFPIPETEYCRVERCVDGDTLIVLSREGKERVRLIGSNTPETVRPNSPIEPFGPEATAFTQKRIEEAKNNVLLEADGDRTDKYGRRLALVWLNREPPLLLNEELIRNGLAKADLQYNYSKTIKERFISAQKEAQARKLGIWSSSASDLNKQSDTPASRPENHRSTKKATSRK